MKKPKHTPAPLSACLNMDGRHHHLSIMADAPEFKVDDWPYHPKIAAVYHGLGHADRKTAEATAARMVLAYNCHDDLLAALQTLMQLEKLMYDKEETLTHEWANDFGTARAAIQKAKGA